LLSYDGYFGSRSAIHSHLDQDLHRSLPWSQPDPSFSILHRCYQKDLIEFMVPVQRSQFDLRSDCEADISAFLAVSGRRPSPSTARSIAWSAAFFHYLGLKSRTTPGPSHNKLDMMFDNVAQASISIAVRSGSRRSDSRTRPNESAAECCTRRWAWERPSNRSSSFSRIRQANTATKASAFSYAVRPNRTLEKTFESIQQTESGKDHSAI
jgi:hypothetical protein